MLHTSSLAAGAATDPALPLAGLHVIELHAIGPVPFAGQLLRSLGATVTRISPPADPGLGVSMKPEYDLLNLGKRVVHLDLKQPAGKESLFTMMASADVMLEGFRPDVLDRLGLAPVALLARFPRLVIGRMPGFGFEGEYAPRAGHDINYLALAGVLHAIGERADPVPPLNLVADFGGGAMHLVVGVLAQLVSRGIHGKGAEVRTSILAGSIGLTSLFHGLIGAGRWLDARASNLLDGATPFYRCYRTADGKHISVGALEPKFFAELVDLFGLTGSVALDKQYDPGTWPAMTKAFAAAALTRTRDAWAELSLGRDACVAPVLTWAEAAQHPHNRANGWFADSTLGPQGVLGFAKPA
jgi:alpha-methylacyl-CoA racemase